ncbi:unnamed protein product [Protopolystoma xenopodis]|uniref:Uncharacterized protein n=1 Tax=Protopolystoma xenopodis TaxID=117903 RepID=A0A3S5C6G8_9PLAT|nr:unnamed protein product [Protopolystoma xenopodis]
MLPMPNQEARFGVAHDDERANVANFADSLAHEHVCYDTTTNSHNIETGYGDVSSEVSPIRICIPSLTMSNACRDICCQRESKELAVIPYCSHATTQQAFLGECVNVDQSYCLSEPDGINRCQVQMESRSFGKKEDTNYQSGGTVNATSSNLDKDKKIAKIAMIVGFIIFGLCVLLVGVTLSLSDHIDAMGMFANTHTHTHTYIYIYIYI